MHKTCPVCRKHSDYVIPSPKFHAHNTPSKQSELNKYLASTARIPCRHFKRSTPSNRFCPFGNDCHYSHDVDGRRYQFSEAQLRRIRERKGRARETTYDPDGLAIFSEDLAAGRYPPPERTPWHIWRMDGDESEIDDLPFHHIFGSGWVEYDEEQEYWFHDTFDSDIDEDQDADEDEDDDEDDDPMGFRSGMANLGRMFERAFLEGFRGHVAADDGDDYGSVFGGLDEYEREIMVNIPARMPDLVNDSDSDNMPPLVNDSDDNMPPLVDDSDDSDDDMPGLVSDDTDNDMPDLVSDSDNPPDFISNPEQDYPDPWTRTDWGPTNIQSIPPPPLHPPSAPPRSNLTTTHAQNPVSRGRPAPTISLRMFQPLANPSTTLTAGGISSSVRLRGSPPRHIPPPGRRRPRPPRLRRDHSRPRYTPRSTESRVPPREDNPWAEDEVNTTETEGEMSERERVRIRLSEESGIHSPTWNSRSQDLRYFNNS